MTQCSSHGFFTFFSTNSTGVVMMHRHLFLVKQIYLDTIYTIYVYFFTRNKCLCHDGAMALVNAASVKNDVYLWIYTMHTIKRHVVMI